MIQVNFFIGAYYDAVLLYGMALNETLYKGKNPRDGYNISRVMWDRTFTGIATHVVQFT